MEREREKKRKHLDSRDGQDMKDRMDTNIGSVLSGLNIKLYQYLD